MSSEPKPRPDNHPVQGLKFRPYLEVIVICTIGKYGRLGEVTFWVGPFKTKNEVAAFKLLWEERCPNKFKFISHRESPKGKPAIAPAAFKAPRMRYANLKDFFGK